MLEWIVKDVWASQDPEREQRIKELVETLKNYNNKPTSIKSEGLLEKMFGN